MNVVRVENEQQMSESITLARDWGWIDVHHLSVR